MNQSGETGEQSKPDSCNVQINLETGEQSKSVSCNVQINLE
jgi:hypothetical protein